MTVPCEYTNHRAYGTGDARWLVERDTPACNCEPPPPMRVCDGCMVRRVTAPTVRCRTCARQFPPLLSLTSITRL